VNELACQVLYEDNHLLLINKPPGLAVMTGTGTSQSVHRWAAGYLKAKYKKPGKVYVGIVHRLDKPTSGILVLARTSKAAKRLAQQFRSETVEKVYWAIVEGIFPGAQGALQHWLYRNDCARTVQASAQAVPGSRLAILHYRRCGIGRGLSWLELRPQTGRRHQIRAQLAHRGYPIYGDIKYGAKHSFAGAIALHAHSLSILHPVTGQLLTFSAEPPHSWQRFAYLGIRLGR